MYKRLRIVVGALAVSGAIAASAAAVTVTEDSGEEQIHVDKRTSIDASTTQQQEWHDLPGASVDVSVPANESRLYDVPFFAESRCAGGQLIAACSVRIVSVDANGVVTELNPAAGLDYAFDSDIAGNADDLREGHGLERSSRLLGGINGATYTIKVQYAVTNANTTFTLDDWHLAVHTNR